MLLRNFILNYRITKLENQFFFVISKKKLGVISLHIMNWVLSKTGGWVVEEGKRKKTIPQLPDEIVLFIYELSQDLFMKDIKNRGVNIVFTTLDCYITEKMKKVVDNYSSCSIEGSYIKTYPSTYVNVYNHTIKTGHYDAIYCCTDNVIKKRHVKGLKSKYLTLIRFIVTYHKEIKRTIDWKDWSRKSHEKHFLPLYRQPTTKELKYFWCKKIKKIGI